jgi:hypothetical protein
MNTPDHLDDFIQQLRVIAAQIPHSPPNETTAALKRRERAFLHLWRNLQDDPRVREFCREHNDGAPQNETRKEGIQRASSLVRDKWLRKALNFKSAAERDEPRNAKEKWQAANADNDPFLKDANLVRFAIPESLAPEPEPKVRLDSFGNVVRE